MRHTFVSLLSGSVTGCSLRITPPQRQVQAHEWIRTFARRIVVTRSVAGAMSDGLRT